MNHEQQLLEAILSAIEDALHRLFSGLAVETGDGAFNAPVTVYDHPARLVRLVDGDTQHYRLDYHFGTLTEERTCRLLGIDTKEVYGPKAAEEYDEGHEQSVFADEWLADGEANWDGDDWPFRVFTPDTGKYGRDLAVCYRRCDGESLNQALIDEYGDAVRYGD